MDDFSDKWREEDGLLLLNGVRGLGPITLRRLLERFRGDPLSLLKASKRDLLQVHGVGKGVVDSIENAVNSDWLKKEKGKIKKHGVDFITNADFRLCSGSFTIARLVYTSWDLFPRDPMSRSLGPRG